MLFLWNRAGQEALQNSDPYSRPIFLFVDMPHFKPSYDFTALLSLRTTNSISITGRPETPIVACYTCLTSTLDISIEDLLPFRIVGMLAGERRLSRSTTVPNVRFYS